jgi:hypothetical protein
MDVSAFRFAIETLEKGKWSVLCLMADDLEAARMACTLVEMLPGEGVRIALIDPHLADKPERILWEHLKDAEPEHHFELAPVPDPIFEIDDRDEADAPRTFRLGSELELDERHAVVRPTFLEQPPPLALPKPSAKSALPDGFWPPSRNMMAGAGGAVMVLAGIVAAVLWSLPERPVITAEQPTPPPIVPARLAAPIAPPPPPAPIAAAAPVAAPPKEVAALYGKWSKDAGSCATEYLLYQPDRSFLFDARTSVASGGTVYYDVAEGDLLAFDDSTEARYRRLDPNRSSPIRPCFEPFSSFFVG